MKKHLSIILIVLFLFLGGCSGDEYTAEKLYWRANKQYNELLKNVDDAKIKDFQRVIFAYRELIGRFPKWISTPNAYFNISQLYVLQKEYAKARAELEKVKEAFSETPEICANADFTIGLIYEEEGEWQKALESFRMIEENYPLSYSALQAPLHIARHYKLAKNEERAF